MSCNFHVFQYYSIFIPHSSVGKFHFYQWQNLLRLLDMYLDPQDGKEPMFKAAVRLLHKHGESLDPLQVLEVWDYLYCLH